MPKHKLVTRLMHAFFKGEIATLAGLLDRPPGKDARYFGDILLSVSAVHAQGVKLDQLAPVIIVESGPPLFQSRRTFRRMEPPPSSRV